jgi:hypothetical protein
MKVVLSHPFSGAVFWWLAVQSGEDLSRGPPKWYRQTLYGDVNRNLDVALACLVVFEEVIIAMAETPYGPEFEWLPNDAQRLPALELTSDYEALNEAGFILDRPIQDELLADPVIRSVVGRLPLGAQQMGLLYATTDVVLTQLHSAPVLCAPGRRKVVLRLIELGVVPVTKGTATTIRQSGGLVEGLTSYANVVSLRFTSDTTESLADVKWNDLIRKYAEGFQHALVSSADAEPGQLYQDLASAWESAELAGKFAGAFSTTSSVMGPAGLIPGVGTVASAIQMATDASGRLAEERSQTFRWYELGPEIRRYESLRDLERALRKRGLRS